MIQLIDLISMSGITLNDYKIHCAKGIKTNPLEAFFDGTFKGWQESQTQNNFKCSQILSLIYMEPDKWLFGGVYSVHGVRKRKVKGKVRYIYSTTELDGLDHLTGKAIILFEKRFRASYLRGEKYGDKLYVSSLREKRMNIGNFPGFNSVLLSYQMLKTLVRENNPSWKTALSNVAGVYVIIDNISGNQYVGSAYGGEGIWHRWVAYTKYGHGGNKELRQLIKAKGNDYAKNFQFSLLEVCDLNSSNDFVISRESHWKNVLRSREFGLNKN